ncbi:MAG: cytochrome P450 [Solirubrobacteraceae bacterium]
MSTATAPVASPAPVAALPPGPRLPRLVQTLGFIFAPVRFMEAARRRYGDIVTFGTAFDPEFVMVFEPNLVRAVFQGSGDQLRAGEANAVLEPIVGRRSVLLLDGSEHLRQRRLILPAFHGSSLAGYQRVMRSAADATIDAWPVGEPFALLESMQWLTLDVIVTTVFGVEGDERREELKRRVRAALEPVSRGRGSVALMLLRGRLGAGGAIARFEQRRRELDQLIYEEIARRRVAVDVGEREDVFSMLLRARDEEGHSLSDGELRDELITLLVAGHETTATGLAWTFDLLLHNPRVLARLRDELSREDGDDAYLDAVVKEALRLRPVVPGIGRVVRDAPFQLGEYVIPEGVEINPSIAVMHRRADSYPQPDAFRPERFLEHDAPDTYTWIPFGGGTRRCLGASFALLEMRTVIRRVLERAQLRPVSARPDRMLRRGITQVPRRGVRVVLGRPPKTG